MEGICRRIQTVAKLISKGMNLIDECILCQDGGRVQSTSSYLAPWLKDSGNTSYQHFGDWAILAKVINALENDLFVGHMSPKASWPEKKITKGLHFSNLEERNGRIFLKKLGKFII